MEISVKDVYARNVVVEYDEDDKGERCIAVSHLYEGMNFLLGTQECHRLGSALCLFSRVLKKECEEEGSDE